jgi:drug/metabolite transporter (DMT)-like permease
MNPVMGAREWLLLVTLSVMWGGSFFFIEVALRELPTLTVVLGRVGIAAIDGGALSPVRRLSAIVSN